MTQKNQLKLTQNIKESQGSSGFKLGVEPEFDSGPWKTT